MCTCIVKNSTVTTCIMREHQNCMPFLIAGSTEKKKQLFGLFGACLSPCLAMLNFCQSDKTRKKSVPTSTGDPEDSNIFRARS